jgi:hypothetical protein
MISAVVRADWETAYRNADYRVQLPLDELLLKVDRHRPNDDLRLRQEAGIRSHWAIVTPCNPGSRAQSAAANQARSEELAGMLQALAIPCFKSINRDPQEQWPDEPGFLLCDPPPGLAENLGRRFEQNAILCGNLGEAPRLLWLID